MVHDAGASPRSPERGSVEGQARPTQLRSFFTSPRSPERGSVEGSTPCSRKIVATSALRALRSAAPLKVVEIKTLDDIVLLSALSGARLR